MKKYSSITRVNSHRTSQTKTRLTVGLTVIGILAFLWFLPNVIGTIASVTVIPIHHAELWFAESSAALPSYLRDRSVLIDDIQALEETVAQSEARDAELAALWWENRELRNQLASSADARILAGVSGRPPHTPYDVLMLDRGSADGITVHAPVFVASSTVIGFVQSVFLNSAIVQLVSTPGFKTSVYVYGPNIYTTAEGMGGGVMRVGVPQGIALSNGDPVIIPSVELGVFGTITHIESEPTSPEQFAFVTTGIPLQSIRTVTVGAVAHAPISFDEARERVQDTADTFFRIAIPDSVLVDLEQATTTAATTVSTTTSIQNE